MAGRRRSRGPEAAEHDVGVAAGPAPRGDLGRVGNGGEHPQRDEHVDGVEVRTQLAVAVRALDERRDDVDRRPAQLLAHLGRDRVVAERLDQARLAALQADRLVDERAQRPVGVVGLERRGRAPRASGSRIASRTAATRSSFVGKWRYSVATFTPASRRDRVDARAEPLLAERARRRLDEQRAVADGVATRSGVGRSASEVVPQR